MFLVLTTICSISVLATAIMMCLCWRKKHEKNDLLGLEGLVTQKNPDENVNHLPSAAIQSVPDGIVTSPDDIALDAIKRPSIVNNPRRSLPDIPFDGELRNYGDVVTYEPSGDNSSDLYATVEPYQNSSSVKRHTLPNGIESRPSVSQHSSLSQADDTFSPYARVKEHPYDKLRDTEHPYAQVQPSNCQEHEIVSSGEGTSRTVGARKERPALQTIGESSANSRSRRSSNQSVVVTSDIPAASAVAGGIAASQELPYMTPPIAQTNFSGDSQDSSRGYTSITVREPLAEIRAQTKLLNRRDLDPHYSTVSDDSDDVYTTIQDPNNAVYTSGSETYAQIQPVPLTAAETGTIGESVHVRSAEENESNSLPYEHTSQLPGVSSLKLVTSTHSRQASSSSSVGLIGSPKPEKRQANSPLPPPPPVYPSFDFLTANPIKSPIYKNLDDMYAKVQKVRKKSDKELEEKPLQRVESKDDHNYETLRKTPLKPYDSINLSNEPGYDTINGPDSLISSDPGYEILKHNSVATSEVDPNYEQLQQITSHSSYLAINNNNCDINNGYSVINKIKNNTTSDEVKSKNSSSYDSETKDLSSTDEPNYESMTSESFSDPNYALLKSTDSESDPNYESVTHNEPNYESVKYLDVSYDQLQNEEAASNQCQDNTSVQCNSVDPGYETIKGDNKSGPNISSNSELETNFEEIVQV